MVEENAFVARAAADGQSVAGQGPQLGRNRFGRHLFPARALGRRLPALRFSAVDQLRRRAATEHAPAALDVIFQQPHGLLVEILGARRQDNGFVRPAADRQPRRFDVRLNLPMSHEDVLATDVVLDLGALEQVDQLLKPVADFLHLRILPEGFPVKLEVV